MGVLSRIKVLIRRYPLMGPLLWAFIVLFIIVQFIAAGAAKKYNFVRDTLSDLGNTACGIFDGHYVCSPLHVLTNISLIVLGACVMAGSILVYLSIQKRRPALIGFVAIFMSGIGMILVGVSPENINELLHYAGAGVVFTGGVVSMIVLGRALHLPRYIRIYALVFGCFSFLALIAMAVIDFDVSFPGEGTIESLVIIPQILWLILFGGYMLYKDLHQLIEHYLPKVLGHYVHK